MFTNDTKRRTMFAFFSTIDSYFRATSHCEELPATWMKGIEEYRGQV